MASRKEKLKRHRYFLIGLAICMAFFTAINLYYYESYNYGHIFPGMEIIRNRIKREARGVKSATILPFEYRLIRTKLLAHGFENTDFEQVAVGDFKLSKYKSDRAQLDTTAVINRKSRLDGVTPVMVYDPRTKKIYFIISDMFGG